MVDESSRAVTVNQEAEPNSIVLCELADGSTARVGVPDRQKSER
jgi:hypothetical protein